MIIKKYIYDSKKRGSQKGSTINAGVLIGKAGDRKKGAECLAIKCRRGAQFLKLSTINAGV